jgi:hypothetical protein
MRLRRSPPLAACLAVLAYATPLRSERVDLTPYGSASISRS